MKRGFLVTRFIRSLSDSVNSTMDTSAKFGPQLIVSKDGEIETVNTEDLFGDGIECIGIYFSSKKCRPCREFTPILKEFYEKANAETKTFEVVYVSFDKNEEQFEEYVKTMPWPAIPYNSEIKGVLKKEYKEGKRFYIPKLVLLHKDGCVMEEDGRRHVEQWDDDGQPVPIHFDEDHDHTTMDPDEKFGPSLTVSKNGEIETVNTEDVFGADNGIEVIGIYFSSMACRPCQVFTPILKEYYEKANAEKKTFEVIYVSFDKSEEKFEEYMKTMPWPAIPYNSEMKGVLKGEYKQGKRFPIPKLILLNKDGSIKEKDGRKEIEAWDEDEQPTARLC